MSKKEIITKPSELIDEVEYGLKLLTEGNIDDWMLTDCPDFVLKSRDYYEVRKKAWHHLQKLQDKLDIARDRVNDEPETINKGFF